MISKKMQIIFAGIIAIIIICSMVYATTIATSIVARINSFSPQIDCLEIQERSNGFNSLVNNCDKELKLYIKDGTLNEDFVIPDPTYGYKSMSPSQIEIVGDRVNFYEVKKGCRETNEYVLENGLNYCDKQSITQAAQKSGGFVVLETYQTKIRLGEQDILLNGEIRYYLRSSPGDMVPITSLLFFLILAALIIAVFLKIKKKIPIWIVGLLSAVVLLLLAYL
ncbi:MAG: hypothetical protein AABW85_03465, partial [archaeon]